MPTESGNGHFIRDYRVCQWLSLERGVRARFLCVDERHPGPFLRDRLGSAAGWSVVPAAFYRNGKERERVIADLKERGVGCVVGDFMAQRAVPLAVALDVPCVLIMQPFSYADELFWLRPLIGLASAMVAPCTRAFARPDLGRHLRERVEFVGPLLTAMQPPQDRGVATVVVVGSAGDAELWAAGVALARSGERVRLVGCNDSSLGPGIDVVGFVDDIRRFVFPDDVVVARAGYNTIMDSLAARVPLVLWPVDDHVEQEANAHALARYGAAVVVRSGNPNELLDAVAAARQIDSDRVDAAAEMLIGRGDGVGRVGAMICRALDGVAP